MKQEGLKIIKANIENFKNISHKEVTFDGKSVFVIGPNESGKSSFIQAICSPVNTKMVPSAPIKEGEERGSVEVTISGTLGGEEMTYNVGLYFSPKHKTGRISVTGEDGEKIDGGKGLVETIVGNVGFDIMEFLRLGRTSSGKVSTAGVREQIEILKQLMPQDTIKNLHEIEENKKATYESRTPINTSIRALKDQLEEHDYSQEDIEKYSERKDPKEVQEKISKIGEAIELWNKAYNKNSELEQSIEASKNKIAELKKMLEKEEGYLTENIESQVKVKNWLKKNPKKPTVGDLTDELNEINEHNAICDDIERLEKQRKDLKDKEDRAEKLTEHLASLEKRKKEIFASNPLPVKGLEFNENEILYKGLPFNEDQHSSAVLIGIGIRIGMAMNPNLKLLVIRDGSLLDEKTLNFILKVCNDEGYQVIIEMVKTEGDMNVEFIEK